MLVSTNKLICILDPHIPTFRNKVLLLIAMFVDASSVAAIKSGSGPLLVLAGAAGFVIGPNLTDHDKIAVC